MVKPKKHLGQHFLKDLSIAESIANSLSLHNDYKQVLEIGPGTGVLSKYLLSDDRFFTYLVEIDGESAVYLRENFPLKEGQLIEGDFLNEPLSTVFTQPTAIIGNFPYNISSQIFFNVFYRRDVIPEVICMIQKEVAERIAAKPGKKVNGILSILLQAFYDIEYLFTVPPDVFNPPPKVDSAVIRLRRNEREKLPCNEKKFVQVVKAGFGQRRKTLRNALKPFNFKNGTADDIFSKRAEQLGVDEFIGLVEKLEV